MNNLFSRKVFLFGFIFLLTISSCNGQFFKKHGSRNADRGLFGKVKEPRTVLKAKKIQEAKDRKLKKDYSRSVKRSQKRTIDIQTPEVQVRMKQNQKNSVIRDNAKKKKVRSNSKKAGKKYK